MKIIKKKLKPPKIKYHKTASISTVYSKVHGPILLKHQTD